MGPAERAAVVSVARPAARAPVPRIVAPSVKVTVPVGVPPLDVTVAVNVTDWPAADGFASEVSVMMVGAASTRWASGLLVLPVEVVSPL